MRHCRRCGHLSGEWVVCKNGQDGYRCYRCGHTWIEPCVMAAKSQP